MVYSREVVLRPERYGLQERGTRMREERCIDVVQVDC